MKRFLCSLLTLVCVGLAPALGTAAVGSVTATEVGGAVLCTWSSPTLHPH